MIPTAMHMLRSSKQMVATTGKNLNIPLIFVQVGVGGGFLIIPALIYLTGIDMKSAVGTSMAIIAFNALIGFFLGDAMTLTAEWSFLTGFTAVAIVGLLIGIYLSNFVNALRLKMVFGCFVLLMACFIFIMEFVLV
ncbi:MAG: TSUP family transporter [Flavobacteriaceae bacterium]